MVWAVLVVSRLSFGCLLIAGCAHAADSGQPVAASLVREVLMSDPQIKRCYQHSLTDLNLSPSDRLRLNFDEEAGVWRASLTCSSAQRGAHIFVTLSPSGAVIEKRRGL